MALIKCPECGQQVSDQAEKCPNCAFPISQRPSGVPASESPARVIEPGPDQLRCVNCGNIVSKKAVVCLSCGKDPRSPRSAVPPKRGWSKRKVLAAVIGLVVIGTCINAVSKSGNSSTPTSASPTTQVAANPSAAQKPTAPAKPTSPPPTVLPSIGGVSETSGWAITLDKIDTAKEVGNQFTKKQAQGLFVLVTFTARNKMNQTSQLNSADLKMKSTDGLTFNSSSEGNSAMLSEEPKPVLFLEEVQPGLSKQFRNVFDVNPGIKDYNIELAGARFRVSI